jgi:hypothetical protein
MRQAMALNSTEIQFFPVDASSSAPEPRALNYQIMSVPVTDDISDVGASKYTMVDLSPGKSVPLGVSSIAIRLAARPMYELFHDRFFRGNQFCTDGFALRVLQAGCTGVRFLDPSRLGGGPMRFRTVRGLEEEGDWDPERKIEHTRLIETIDSPR